MRTITAPGVEIKEIDKSQYSPAMVGTACYIMGFSDKGEPYRPMEFTSRASWQSYYGEPDNEAERYFYNAAVEVLNNNGRLYCARLPYDNPAFEKMVGFRYTLSPELSIDSDTPFFEIQKADATIKTVRAIESKGVPYLLDLSAVDELRTDEAKVMNNSFVIVDTTCGTLKPIVEDERKGVAREMIGIMPVVTTAANALFAQKYLEVENQCAIGYETIGCPITVKTDDQPCNNVLEKDCCRLLNTGSWYSEITTVPYLLSTSLCVDASDIDNDPAVIADIESQISGWIDLSAWNKSYQKTDDDAPSGQMAVGISYLSALTQTEYAAQLDVLSSDPKITSLFGWHGKDYDDNLPETVSQEANTFFPTIGFNSETNTFDREHLKKIGVVVYKMFLDPAEGNKINFEPVEAFVGSLCKDDKDPNTGTTTFIDTIINNNSEYIYCFSNLENPQRVLNPDHGFVVGSDSDYYSIDSELKENNDKEYMASSLFSAFATRMLGFGDATDTELPGLAAPRAWEDIVLQNGAYSQSEKIMGSLQAFYNQDAKTRICTLDELVMGYKFKDVADMRLGNKDVESILNGIDFGGYFSVSDKFIARKPTITYTIKTLL